MKKIIVVLTIILMLTACSQNSIEVVSENETTPSTEASISETPDFRNVNWGMSVESVITAEGTPTSENHYDGEFDGISELIYKNISVMDYNATLCYHFEQDALSEAFYNFNCYDQTDQQINSMYYNIYKKYVEKYNVPESTSFEMSNSDYNNITEPPLINDEDFSFGNIATYKSNWNNRNGASISMNLTYAQKDSTDKHILFTITYTAVSSDI